VSAVLSVTKTSTYERRLALTKEGDRRQEQAIQSVLKSGFALDWKAILAEVGDLTSATDVIGHALLAQLRDDDFTESGLALGMNGKLIAAYIQKRTEEQAGLKLPLSIPLTFRESTVSVFTPERAVAHWKKLLELSDEDALALLENVSALEPSVFAMRARLFDATMDRIATEYERAISQGADLAAFKRNILEILPDASESLIETEFRTHLTNVYGTSRHEQILERANAFPFIQFMALLDTRTTWDICRPMGTAGPGGRGYIAASDDPLWFIWREPNHFRCRAATSPISYLEAQRLGILAKDGRTKIPKIGSNPNRPFGDPPRFAAHPTTGELRRVEPAPGFGA